MAGYFLDISDPVNSVELDAVSLGGVFVGNVLSGCEYRPGYGVGGVREVNGWRWCFENQSTFIQFAPAVTFPSGWSRTSLSTIFDWNVTGVP